MPNLIRSFSVIFWLILVAFSTYLTMGNMSAARFSSSGLTELVRNASILDISRMETTLTVPTKSIFSCTTASLQLQLSLRLKQLDLLFGHEELAKSQLRLASTLDFLRGYLRCQPTDGNAWARAALISNTMMFDADITPIYLSLSSYYAPYQTELVATRISVINNLSPRLKNEYKDLLLERPTSLRDGIGAN